MPPGTSGVAGDAGGHCTRTARSETEPLETDKDALIQQETTQQKTAIAEKEQDVDR